MFLICDRKYMAGTQRSENIGFMTLYLSVQVLCLLYACLCVACAHCTVMIVFIQVVSQTASAQLVLCASVLSEVHTQHDIVLHLTSTSE